MFVISRNQPNCFDHFTCDEKEATSPVFRHDMFILPHYTIDRYWHEAVRVARARGLSRITVAKTNFSYSIIGCNCCIKCTYQIKVISHPTSLIIHRLSQLEHSHSKTVPLILQGIFLNEIKGDVKWSHANFFRFCERSLHMSNLCLKGNRIYSYRHYGHIYVV